MLASDLINPHLPTIKPHDTVGKVLALMEDSRLSYLPIAEQKSYIDIAEEDTLLNFSEETLLKETLLGKNPPAHLWAYQHLYELLTFFSHSSLSLAAVLDEEKQFIGAIEAQQVYKIMAEKLLLTQSGAILELSIKSRDYSLAEVSRLIEGEKAKILSCYFSEKPNEIDVEAPARLVLKINRNDISSIVATLERFGYLVEASYAHQPIESIDQERYQALMRYLEV